MYSSKFPKEMVGYFDLQWDINKIWNLNLPIKTCEVKQFKWQMQYPFWATQPPDKIFDLSPNEVLNNLDKYPKQYKKILNADITFPIETTYFGSLLIILDGFHRLAHHIINGKKEIQFRVVPKESLNNCA